MEFLSSNTPMPDGLNVYPWMSVKAKDIKCTNLAILSDDDTPLAAPSLDLSTAVVRLTNIYEEEINYIFNHNTQSFYFGGLNVSADFVASENAIVKWDDREQNCTLRRLVNAQTGIATPHWMFALSDETAAPLVDLFMYVEFHATIDFSPHNNDDPWTFNIILETSSTGSFGDETVIAQDYIKEILGEGTQYRDISWIIPQVIPKTGTEGPYFRLIMRQTAGAVGTGVGVEVNVQSMMVRVSVKPYVRSIKLF